MRKSLLCSVMFVFCLSAVHAQINWYKQSLPTPVDSADLAGVSFVDASVGTAVGWGGVVVRTSTGGTTWVKQNSGTMQDLFGVTFTDANTGTAVGFEGTIIRTTDAGATWTNQLSIPNTILGGVSFADHQTGCAVGAIHNGKFFIGAILRTTNGGMNWRLDSNINWPTFTSVQMIDANTITVVGDYETIMRSIDGGTTWETQHRRERGNLTSVSFANAEVGTAVGYITLVSGAVGTMLRTTNAGITWTDVDIGIMPVLFGVSTHDINNTLAVGTRGTIMQTSDAGVSWTIQSIDTSAVLTAISRTNVNTVTLVGFKGLVLRSTSADPSSVKLVDNTDEAPLRAFPNPASHEITIQFGVSRQGTVVLDIVDALGNVIAVVANEVMQVGAYETAFDVSSLSGGAYFYRLRNGGQQQLLSLVVTSASQQ